MQLSIVIVNYNVKYYLEQCLTSVRRASRNIEAEVFVVDNCSTDGSIPYLKERFPEVHFIENKDNVGFAKANNQAIALSTGKYVLLLNPDTIVGEHTFEECVTFMDEHDDAGGVGVHMLRIDGTFAPESRRGLPTPFVAFCKMSGLSQLFPKSRIFGKYYMRYLDEHEVNPIEIISGAYMLLRREALDKVGLLDETFFMYGEDIDLSYRVMKGGYTNYYIPTNILHYKGESTEKSSYRYVYTFYQAMRLFFNKHYSHYSFLISFPITLAIWVRSFLVYAGNQLRHRKPSPTKVVRNHNFLVIGDKNMLEEVRAILEREQPQGNHYYLCGTEVSLPQGHATLQQEELQKYDYVVYDTDHYSYDTLLKNFAVTPDHHVEIATYSSTTKVLITISDCYK